MNALAFVTVLFVAVVCSRRATYAVMTFGSGVTVLGAKRFTLGVHELFRDGIQGVAAQRMRADAVSLQGRTTQAPTNLVNVNLRSGFTAISYIHSPRVR